MSLQRFDSFLDDVVMPQSFSTMLDRFFNDSVSNRRKMANFTPHVDTSETENGFEIELTLPGLKKEDINIEFQEGRLTISGERKWQNENNNKRYHQIESQYGAFMRAFNLPQNIDTGAIEAQFQDGILRINIPKDKQKVMKHQIQVKGSSQSQVGPGKSPEAQGANPEIKVQTNGSNKKGS